VLGGQAIELQVIELKARGLQTLARKVVQLQANKMPPA